MIPTFRPSLGVEERRGIEAVLASGWLRRGETVDEFERQLSGYFGGRHVLAVSTGTAALHLALLALDLGPGDQVLVPSLTFVSTVQAIVLAGGEPVFCEVQPSTLNLDPADARRRLTPRCRAILPVHYGGQACDLDAIAALAAERGLRVVEDAAHAFGSTWRGEPIGSFGDIACFSFDAIKNVTCGEGGALVTADNEVARRARIARNLGIDADSSTPLGPGIHPVPDVVGPGYRYHLDNLHAAIGLAQLAKMASFLARKRAIVAAYEDAFRHLPNLVLLERNWDETFPFSFVFRVLGGRRDDLAAFLRARGIATMVQFHPVHLWPAFAPFRQDLPVTEALYREILTLPLFVDMTDDEVQFVTTAVRQFFGTRDST